MTQKELWAKAHTLENVLNDYNIMGKVTKISKGPVVTFYEYKPLPGTKSVKVINLADDVARSMSAISCRISIVPGRDVLGIELPNEKREMVVLKDMFKKSEQFVDKKLPVGLGKDIAGRDVVVDISRMPHVLVAGTTGSGKSVAINTFIASLLRWKTPAECKFIMIDPKMLEMSAYKDIPHLLVPVITDSYLAVDALRWAVFEMDRRYEEMSKANVRNIEGYNNGSRRFPYIVIFIDEVADLMLVAGKDVEVHVQRIAQKARAAGIHLVMATQRPSVDVITGTIKANFPTRIAFKVTTKIDSRTILNDQGAEKLLGMGDMLYMSGSTLQRVHGSFISDEDLSACVKLVKDEYGPPKYEQFLDNLVDEAEAIDNYGAALQQVLIYNKCTAGFIQRVLGVGYLEALSIVQRMEREGKVSVPDSQGNREVYITTAE